MSSPNASNERLKRRYAFRLKEANGRADITVNHALRALAAYEQFTGARDFKTTKSADAIAYRKHLMAGPGRRAAELSSRATVRSKLLHVKKFFVWLSGQEGYRSRNLLDTADYFDLPRRDRRIADERRNDEAPSPEQLRQVILAMPAATDREKRDRALMAFLYLTGARVKATTSFKLKHVLPSKLGIKQDAREVETKGGRSFVTGFFPVGDDVREIFLDWEEHLRETLLCSPHDPLFPSCDTIAATRGDNHRLTRRHWCSADPIRRICRQAFDAAGIPYHSPHTIRRSLAVFGEQICQTAEEFKAWSQNLGHLQVLTTFTGYGGLSDRQQLLIMAKLSKEPPSVVLAEIEQFLADRGYSIELRERGADQ
jgi:site-specific recombinase XerD